jgi:hypothetical protein
VHFCGIFALGNALIACHDDSPFKENNENDWQNPVIVLSWTETKGLQRDVVF